MDNHKPVSLDLLVEAIRKVLLAKVSSRAEYENRKPTQEERHERWRLEKR